MHKTPPRLAPLRRVAARSAMAATAQSPTDAVPVGMGVLEKAMGLLNVVSANRAPMTFTELLRVAGLPRASLHRTLSTLTREGLLRHDPYNKTFKLGFRLLELAHEVWSDFDLRLAAQDELTALRDTLGETVLLATLDQEKVVVVACEEASRQSDPRSRTGQLLPVEACALGHAMAAYLDPARQRRVLDERVRSLGSGCPAGWADTVQSQWDLARARGYAMVANDLGDNSLSVAVPVFDIEGHPVGAVGVTGPIARLDEKRAHALSSTLIGAARRMAHNAGGEGMSLLPQGPPAAHDAAGQRCVVQTPALLGEGPMWSTRDASLYWVDILTPAVHCHNPASGTNVQVKLGAMASCVVPKTSGGLLLATPGGLVSFDLATRQTRVFAHPEADRPGNRYNDGKCDRLGRLWIGSMDMGAAANRGNLYRVDATGHWKKMDSGFTVSNGLAWSPDDRHMYFTDSFRRTVYRYEFDLRSGQIANRRALVVLGPGEGTPDGLTVDEHGCLWMAVWDAWCLVRFSPEGQEMQRVRLPVPRPTSCCFGGSNLDTLFVTSASVRLSQDTLDAAPLSGSVFAIQLPGVRGLPETMFAG